jgi:hypothetical protein
MNKKLNEAELSSGLSGVSGEYFVAAELSRRGYIASITLRNTKGVDILCSNSDATNQFGIQVKTNRRSNREWVLNSKSESYFADNLFYVFVNLHGTEKSPDYFIVPSSVVAKSTKETHQTWLDTPGRNGKSHRDNTIRKFTDLGEEFLNRWDLLL